MCVCVCVLCVCVCEQNKVKINLVANYTKFNISCMGLDKSGYQVHGFLSEVLLMSTHNICFC